VKKKKDNAAVIQNVSTPMNAPPLFLHDSQDRANDGCNAILASDINQGQASRPRKGVRLDPKQLKQALRAQKAPSRKVIKGLRMYQK